MMVIEYLKLIGNADLVQGTCTKLSIRDLLGDFGALSKSICRTDVSFWLVTC